MKLKNIEIRVNGSCVKHEYRNLDVPDTRSLFSIMEKAAEMIADELRKGPPDDAKEV